MPGLIQPSENGERLELHSPTAMPRASSFLWNRQMLLQVSCRGYVNAQHIQVEASKYSHAPVPEQKTFMLPEHPQYAHHPGRFVYVRDEDSGNLFSLPHEPVRQSPESFVFSVGKTDIEWRVTHPGLATRFSVSLPVEDVVELWSFEVSNTGTTPRRLNICPTFSIGYMSWMNQSACYRPELGGIVASSVTPYQKLEDYPRIKTLKDLTFLLHDTTPDAWEASREAFEGEGGEHNPDAMHSETLANGDAIYEVPVAALQYRIELQPGETRQFNFLFGPAHDDAAIRSLQDRFLVPGAFKTSRTAYYDLLESRKTCLQIKTPDPDLDNFVNHWLGRQVLYHGDTHRLTTDPQTRNYLQDGMGMVYVDPAVTRETFRRTLSQQERDGAMPDGVVLVAGAELKYINQVPHTDHGVWLPVCLQAYLDETADYSFLGEPIAGAEDTSTQTIFDRITAAMHWLIGNRDERGLSLIAQGDWCDPMNMVGHKGRGVSGWLSIATVHALRIWSGISKEYGSEDVATLMAETADEMDASVQKYLWDGDWFARGITDDGNAFGVSKDAEGRIFLNPQSWAILAGISTADQNEKIVESVRKHLDTKYGAMVLAPAYTAMREDIGRLTQKHPGTAENGAIYCHAAMFYVFALFQLGDADSAYSQLRRMIPGPSENDIVQRGQMPAFVPNYYRGAVSQFPRTAGRSSQLFNTGAASWMYRSFVEGLFGLKGCADGLRVTPNLPGDWRHASVSRRFRGAMFEVEFRRDPACNAMQVHVDGEAIDGQTVRGIEPGRTYRLDVILP